MRRGDVYLVDLNPPRGSEADKIQPAVVVSNDAANRVAERTGRGVITVVPVTMVPVTAVPVTSNVTRIYPFQISILASEGGLPVASKAQAEQVRSIDYARLRGRLGSLPPDRLAQLDAALRVHLDL